MQCLATPWKPVSWPLSLCDLADCPDQEIVGLTSSTACLAIDGALPLQLPCTTVFAVLYHSLFICIIPALPIVVMFLSVLYESISFESLILSSTCFCTHCTSNFWAYNNIYSLLISLVSLRLIILLWSFLPCFHHGSHLWIAPLTFCLVLCTNSPWFWHATCPFIPGRTDDFFF